MCACGKMYTYKVGGDLLDIQLQNQIDRGIPYKNIIDYSNKNTIYKIGTADYIKIDLST